MNFDRLSPFLGKPMVFNGVKVYSPTIEKIELIGEMQYRLNLLLATFDKEKILLDLYKMSDDDYDKVESLDDFEFLVSDFQMIRMIEQAISFFVEGEIKYSIATESFEYKDAESGVKVSLVGKEDYKEFVELLKFLNGMNNEEKPQLTFKNESAKKMMKELEKMRKKNAKKSNDGLELKDILSLLCSSEGNGITVFNVHNLTVYQAYEHFERLGLKVNRTTILPVWANGHLKEGEKLPDIFIKTSF